MKKLLILTTLLFVMAMFFACVHQGVTFAPSKDPNCPDGYSWKVGMGKFQRGACLADGKELHPFCFTYRQPSTGFAFWDCSNHPANVAK